MHVFTCIFLFLFSPQAFLSVQFNPGVPYWIGLRAGDNGNVDRWYWDASGVPRQIFQYYDVLAGVNGASINAFQ